MPEHPMQPVVLVGDVARFKQNRIVRFLTEFAQSKGISLNELALMPFEREDWEQLAQLIGCSVSGFGDLSYASPEAVAVADAAVEELLAKGKS